LPLCCRTAVSTEPKRRCLAKLSGMLYLRFEVSVCTEWLGWLSS
jgi:hypothetical protein